MVPLEQRKRQETMRFVRVTAGQNAFDLIEGPGVIAVKRTSLMMQCPCGCGDNMQLTGYPNSVGAMWTWDAEKGNIAPSVRIPNCCKAHFTVTEFKVQWHGDSGQ